MGTGLKKPPNRIGTIVRILAGAAGTAFILVGLTQVGEGDWLSAVASIGLASVVGLSAIKGIDKLDSTQDIERHACPCCDCLTLQYDNEDEEWLTSACPICEWVANPEAVEEHLGYTLHQARDHFQRYFRFYPPADAAKWGASPATPEEIDAKREYIRASALLVASKDTSDARYAWRALEMCEREVRALTDQSRKE